MCVYSKECDLFSLHCIKTVAIVDHLFIDIRILHKQV